MSPDMSKECVNDSKQEQQMFAFEKDEEITYSFPIRQHFQSNGVDAV